jgi:hypothetical protein
MSKEKALPQATPEIAKEYDELYEQLSAVNFAVCDDSMDDVKERLFYLEQNYDWDNIVFTDPETGKKCVKNVKGDVLVPARYDDIVRPGNYIYNVYPLTVAAKDGKYGIVIPDGRGLESPNFKYDYLLPIPFTLYFRAYWNGDKSHFGIVDAMGKVLCPNTLTTIYEPDNAIMIIGDKDGKLGAINMAANMCVLPEYDRIEPDDALDMLFYKGDEKFYITTDGQVVAPEHRDDPEYDDSFFLNSDMMD